MLSALNKLLFSWFSLPSVNYVLDNVDVKGLMAKLNFLWLKYIYTNLSICKPMLLIYR